MPGDSNCNRLCRCTIGTICATLVSTYVSTWQPSTRTLYNFQPHYNLWPKSVGIRLIRHGLSFGASTLHSGSIHQADSVAGTCHVIHGVRSAMKPMDFRLFHIIDFRFHSRSSRLFPILLSFHNISYYFHFLPLSSRCWDAGNFKTRSEHSPGRLKPAMSPPLTVISCEEHYITAITIMQNTAEHSNLASQYLFNSKNSQNIQLGCTSKVDTHPWLLAMLRLCPHSLRFW